MGKSAVEPPRLAAIKPEHGRGHLFEEPAVVADEDQRRTAARQFALEPFDGGKVEMVGRLVEQQDVGLGRHDRASAARRASPPDRVAGSACGSRPRCSSR